jgi:hypothetical protein
MFAEGLDVQSDGLGDQRADLVRRIAARHAAGQVGTYAE